MAIKKIGSLPVADSERPISVPKMPSESTASGNNTEVIEAGNKPDIPHTDSSIDMSEYEYPSPTPSSNQASEWYEN